MINYIELCQVSNYADNYLDTVFIAVFKLKSCHWPCKYSYCCRKWTIEENNKHTIYIICVGKYGFRGHGGS